MKIPIRINGCFCKRVLRRAAFLSLVLLLILPVLSCREAASEVGENYARAMPSAAVAATLAKGVCDQGLFAVSAWECLRSGAMPDAKTQALGRP